MNDEKIEVRVTSTGQTLQVVVLNKRLDMITIVLGEGVHNVRCDLLPTRNGSAYVGYRKFTPEHSDVLPDFDGLVADLGLSYTLLGATSFGATYRRDLTYSYEEFQPFFIDNTIGASVRRALGSRFDVIGSIDRHRYDYQQTLTLDASAPNAPQQVDTTWSYAASVGYRLRPESRLGFGVSYWQRDSTTRRFREYDNLRVGISLTSGF